MASTSLNANITCMLCRYAYGKWQDRKVKSAHDPTILESCTYFESITTILSADVDGTDAMICSVCSDYVDQFEMLQMKVKELNSIIWQLYHNPPASNNTDKDEAASREESYQLADSKTEASAPAVALEEADGRDDADDFDIDYDGNDDDGDEDYRPPEFSENGGNEEASLTIENRDFKSESENSENKGVFIKMEDEAASLGGKQAKKPRKKRIKMEKTFFCDQCPKVLTSEKHLLRHKSNHDRPPNPNKPAPELKEATCNLCKLKLKTERLLAKHLFSVHSVVVPFSCTICQLEFKSEKDYSAHRRQEHSTPVKCDQCSKSFLGPKSLESHMMQFHGTEAFQEICEICSKFCKNKGNLKTHMRTHFQVKEFQCNLCEKNFKWESSLISHIKAVHNPIGPGYKCDVCNRGFKDRNNLKKHEFTHSNDKPYECELCRKGFIRKDLYHAFSIIRFMYNLT